METLLTLLAYFHVEVFFILVLFLLISISTDSSNHKEESVEVGVIVMGLCCICLVACALVVLQLRSNNRRISGNRQRSGPTGNVAADRSRDPLDDGAPPSYDAGILMVTHYPKINLFFKKDGNYSSSYA